MKIEPWSSSLYLLSCNISEPSIKTSGKEKKSQITDNIKYFVSVFFLQKTTDRFLFVLLQGCVMFTSEFYMQTIIIISNVI